MLLTQNVYMKRGTGRSAGRDCSMKKPNFRSTASEYGRPKRQIPNGKPVLYVDTGTCKTFKLKIQQIKF